MLGGKKENIINFEAMGGWPIYKMCLRDILMKFCKEDDDKIYIEKSSPLLDVYPSVLDTDCMGYGVNERKIIEIGKPYKEDEKLYINFFTEEELKDVELWRETDYNPYVEVYNKELKKWVVLGDIRKTEKGYEYLCQSADKEMKDIGWYSENCLTYKPE